MSYNLPIDELMEVFDNAINTGYTIAWGSDVSESGFTRDGVAVMPDNDKVQELSGSDMAHWLKLKPEEKETDSNFSVSSHTFTSLFSLLGLTNN